MLRTAHEIEYWIYKDKKLLYEGKQKCNSYLRNWVNLLCAWFQQTTKPVVKEDGSSVNLGWRWYGPTYCDSRNRGGGFGLLLNAGDNDASYGLVVGYGTAPVSPDDYKLEHKYLHGSGAGYLDYDITKISDVVLEDNKLKFSVERAFYNNHDSPQDITEVGLMARWRFFAPGFANEDHKFLIMRDVLDTALTVPAYATAVVRYNIYFIVG